MKKIILILFLILSSSVFAQTPQYGGTLVFGRTADSNSMDPSHVTSTDTYYATGAIYDTLVQFKYGSTEIVPALAKSWDISKDGLTYIFHLRKGVYFSKTKYFKKKSEFTAKDVVFSLKRQFDKNHPYNKVGGPFKFWLGMDMSGIIKDVIAVDKYTVKITLKKKEAPLLADLAMDFVSILSKDYADILLKKGKQSDLAKKPVGTGPFVFKKWIKDDKIIFSANKNYWDGRPYVDKLILKVIINNSVRAAELRTGSIHILDMPNPAEIASLGADPKIKLIKQEALQINYLSFNQEKKPFDNLLVRKAISHAINAKGIINSIYEGLGVATNSAIPPKMWAYKKLKGYDYDIKKAKQLLKEAGFPNGFKTTLWASPKNTEQKVAEAMQADLVKIGIKAKIVTYDWGTFLKKVYMGEHDMLYLAWLTDNGDPDNFLNLLLSKTAALKRPTLNVALWKNDEFTKLVNEGKVVADIKKRTKLYEQAQVIFDEQAVWKPILTPVVVVPLLKKVHGFKLDLVGKKRFKEVWLEK